jgi:hypothetical protein
MTHTLHRRGKKKSYRKDIVMLIMSSKGINTEGSTKWKKEFFDAVLENGAVNVGEGVKLFLPLDKLEKDKKFYSYIKDKITDRSNPMAVFDDPEKATASLKKLKESGNPLSFVISSDVEITRSILNHNSISSSAVELRVIEGDDHDGVFGKTSLLPEEHTLEIHSLCGHGMVSYSLIQRVLNDTKLGRISSEDGSKILARPCSCCVFNKKRAEEVLEQNRLKNSEL